MKGTISKIFHNERSSKFTVEGKDFLTNMKERRDLSVGDVVEFTEGKPFGKSISADNVKKLGRDEAPPKSADTPAQSSGDGAGSGARGKPWSKGKDDPDTAARIARSVALAESIKFASTLLAAGALPLPKDEKKQTDAVVAFVKSTREEFYAYVAGVTSQAPADGAPKGGDRVADLGQE
jgi:hypothetical protein